MAQSSQGGSQFADGSVKQTRVRRIKVRKRSKDRRPTPGFLAKYGLDVLILLLLALAFVALTYRWHRWFTEDTTIGGVILLSLTIGLGLVRMRHHLLNSNRWLDTNPCSRCGHAELKRTPRKPWHYALASITGLPLRRYICAACGWKGLRLDESKIDRG